MVPAEDQTGDAATRAAEVERGWCREGARGGLLDPKGGVASDEQTQKTEARVGVKEGTSRALLEADGGQRWGAGSKGMGPAVNG